MKRWRGVLGLLLVLGFAAPGAGETPTGTLPVELQNVTVEPRADGVAVILRTTGSVKYAASLIDTPTRLVIDLEATAYGWRKTPFAVSMDPVEQIRGSQFRNGVTRVVLQLSRKVAYRIEERESGITVMLDNSAPIAPSLPAPVMRTLAASLPAPIRLAQAAPPQPGAGSRLISLDFKDADVVNLLRILAAESGKNIVAGEDVKGKVSISLKNVTWELALDTILESRGLQKIEKDNVIRIVSTEQLAKDREAKAKSEEAKLKAEAEIRAKIAEAELKEQEVQQRKLAAQAALAEAQARGPLKEETIRLSYADPEEVAKTLQGILGIPPEGIQAGATPITAGPPPIAEPPFSALYGPGQPPPRPAAVSPTQDVLAKGITIRAHKPTNSIFIRHYEADLERVKTLIKERLDVPLPQVKIEARMEILDRTALEAIGIQWGGAGAGRDGRNILVGQGFSDPTRTTGIAPASGQRSGVGSPLTNPNVTLGSLLPVATATGLPSGGNVVNLPFSTLPAPASTQTPAGAIAFGIIGTRFNVNLALQALETQSKTKTLARPEIITVENNKATMSIGEEIPYATVSSAGTQIQFKEALLKLEVTPTVIREGDVNKIKMKVVVENNARGSVVDLGTSGGSPPAINKRKAETEVVIKEGEYLVIGGVTQRTTAETIRKIPLLGDLPILGWLFKSRELNIDPDRELVVFIKPSVVTTGQLTTVQPQQPPGEKPKAP